MTGNKNLVNYLIESKSTTFSGNGAFLGLNSTFQKFSFTAFEYTYGPDFS